MEDKEYKQKELELLLLEKERRSRQSSPENQPEDNRPILEKIQTAAGIPGANRAFSKIFGIGKAQKEMTEKAYQEALRTNPIANKAGEFVADAYSSIPFYLAGSGAVQKLSKAAPYLAKNPYLSGILGASLGGGIHGLAKEPENDETRLQNMANEAAMAGSVDAVLPGFGKAFNYFKPSSYIARKFGSAIPKSEILENAAIAKGTSTPLGDILGSAPLKKGFENEIAPLAGEAADNAFSGAAKQVVQKGEDLLKGIRQPSGAQARDANYELSDILKGAYKKQRTAKNKLYNKASDIAEKEGFSLELPSFSRLARKTAQEIEESPLLKYDTEAKKIYNRIVNYQKTSEPVKSTIIGKDGKPLISKTITPKIKDANYLANKFEVAAERYAGSPNAADREISGLYEKFAKNLRQDVESQISKKGSEALQGAASIAKQNYKEKFTPFLDRDIFKLTQGSKDAETLISDIVRAGPKDKFKRIEKIQNLLPENQRGILGHEYLSGAYNKSGKFSPNKFSTLVGKLGKRQINALFPDKEVQKQLLDYQKLTNMNNEAIYRMFNPRTGQRGINPLSSILKTTSAVGGAILGGGAGLPGQIAGAAIGQTIPKQVAKKLSKNLTSEAYRDLVIDKIMGLPSTKKYSPVKDILASAFKSGIVSGSNNMKDENNGAR